jgi:hypothetical protein
MEGLGAVERPCVPVDDDRVEPTVRVGDRSEETGGFGPVGPGDVTENPMSKDSAVIRPRPATHSVARSNCQRRDDTGS